MSYEEAAAHPAVRLFEALLDCPSPPGHERELARRLREEIARMGYEHSTDGAGNVLVPLPSERADAPLTVLAAHMDELGLTVSGVGPDGLLRVVPSGRIEVHKLGERPVTVFGSRRSLTGVVALGSSHQALRGTAPAWADARIVTGLSPAALEEAGVRIGTPISLPREGRGPVFLGEESDPMIAAWTFDDRMGCVALLRLLEAVRRDGLRARRPVTVAFTTHEEGSGHGAMSLCQRLRPEVFVAVDGCPVTDAMPLSLDGRAAVWTRDTKAIYDLALVDLFARLARDAGTELQCALYEHAASDASDAYSVGAAERVALMGHVRMNSHGFEVARLSVFDNVLKVLERFVAEWS